jgi:hypothetical protein
MNRLPIALAVMMLAAVPGSAQNLLVNPGFDVADQLNGWSCSSSNGSASWSSDDRLGDPTSGSVQHDLASSSNPQSMSCNQCVPVTEGSTYIASGWYLWPDDPDVSQLGSTRATFRFYENADCTGLSFAGPLEIVDPVLDTWTYVSTNFSTAPLGYHSAKVFFFTWHDLDGEAVRTRLDDLQFYAVSLIFLDGFESADLSAWSASVP